MVRLENKRSRSHSRQKVDGLNRHEENFHNAVSAWTADAYAMGVSSGKHKGVKQFYKVKEDRRLACNPESCERKKRLANNIDERDGLSASTVIIKKCTTKFGTIQKKKNFWRILPQEGMAKSCAWEINLQKLMMVTMKPSKNRECAVHI